MSLLHIYIWRQSDPLSSLAQRHHLSNGKKMPGTAFNSVFGAPKHHNGLNLLKPFKNCDRANQVNAQLARFSLCIW